MEGNLRVLPGLRSYSLLPVPQKPDEYSSFFKAQSKDIQRRRLERRSGIRESEEERTSLARAIRLLCPEIPAAAPHIYDSPIDADVA